MDLTGGAFRSIVPVRRQCSFAGRFAGRAGLKTARVAPRSANEPKTMFRLRYGLADERSRESVRRLTALQGELGVNPAPCAPPG